jgi:hypothetical protein
MRLIAWVSRRQAPYFLGTTTIWLGWFCKNVVPEDLVKVFDLLAGQPESVRVLESDSGLVVRLLLARWRGRPIGLEILSRCGPEAADLLFEKGGYAGSPEGRPAALAILARHGWSGVELLRAFRDDASWHRLLRRVDLMDTDEEPLIVRLAGKLQSSSQRQDGIERYLKMPRQQNVEEGIPPTLIGQTLEWIPGCVAVHTAYNAAGGVSHRGLGGRRGDFRWGDDRLSDRGNSRPDDQNRRTPSKQSRDPRSRKSGGTRTGRDWRTSSR